MSSTETVRKVLTLRASGDSVRSAFKATYKEPCQQDRSSGIQTRFLNLYFVPTSILPLSHPNFTVLSLGKRSCM